MARITKYAESLASVVVNLPQPVVIVDRHLKIQYVNKYAPKFFGYTANQLLQLNLCDLIDAEYLQSIKLNIINLISNHAGKNSRSKSLVTSIIKRDKTRMPIDVTIAQVLTNTNELNVLLRFDYHLQNATKKHHIEEQLEKASASFEVINALDMLDDPVVIFDDKWRYQFINKAGWNVLDEDRAEVLGRNVWQLRPHLKDSEYKKAAYRAMKTQMTVEIEEFYPKTQFWYKTKFFPSSHSLVAQMKNITEYRNAQLMNTQLLGDLEQAMEAYWSEENRALREKKKKAST